MRQKLFVLLTMMFVGFTSCYDASELIDRLDDHEQRIRTLESLCAQMNTSISSLQTIVDALKQNDYVVSVAPIKYGDEEVGYSIIFTSGKTITIYHGKNGTDGVNGSTPQIGVKKFTDGVYYWTLNGEWILDDAGQKIRVTGKDGQNGADGTDGKDAVAPKLKIEDDYWYVSYDNGASWIQLQKAVGEDGTDGKDGVDGDSLFQKIDQTKDAVILTLADGTIITLPKVTEFDVIIDTDHYFASVDETITIPFTVVGATEEVHVECLSTFEAIQGSARMISETKGEIKAVVWYYEETIPYKLIVFFSNGNKQMIMKAFTFEKKVLKSVQDAYEATVHGGIVEVKVSTNMDYEVIIPESAKSWISVVETKAVRTDVLQFKVEPITDGNDRYADITVKSTDGTKSYSFLLFQYVNLNFRDQIIKRQCVAAFDTDGDGELSFAEAAAVTDLNALDLYDKSFVSFDEFKYFTGVTEIPSNYFYGCQNLKSISLPKSLKTINQYAFSHCEYLEVVNLPEGLESIKNRAFDNCRLTSLYIPGTVKSISSDSFMGCYNLSSIAVDEKNENYDSRDNCNAIIRTRDNTLIVGTRDTKIPDSVKILGKYSFAYRSFNYDLFEIPEGVEEIGQLAFCCCSAIGKLKISSTVTKISDDAFSQCQVPDYVEVAYGNPVYDSRMKSNTLIHTSTNTLMWGSDKATIPYGIEAIGSFAFYDSDIEVVNVPETVKKIGSSAFQSCHYIKSVLIPGSVAEIGSSAFAECSNLTSLVLSEGVTTIGNNAFNDCYYLKSVSFPKTLKRINQYAFDSCDMLDVIYFPGELDYIGHHAFYDSGRDAVCIPEGVKSLGPEALPYLNTLILGETVPTLEYPQSIFSSSSSSMEIYVPSGSLEAYKSAPGWSDYADQFVGYGADDMQFVELTEVREGSRMSSGGKIFIDYEFATEGNLYSDKGSGYRLSIEIPLQNDNTITPGFYVASKDYNIDDHQFGYAYLYIIENGSSTSKKIDRGLLKVEVDDAGVYTFTFESSVINARYVGPLQ